MKELKRRSIQKISARAKKRKSSSLNQALGLSGFKPEKRWGKLIEDRASQITFSASGQQAPIEEKKRWGPDVAKRLHRALVFLVAFLGYTYDHPADPHREAITN
jgi:hypothetical protein